MGPIRTSSFGHAHIGLLNCEMGGLDCRVITTEYRTRVHSLHM